MPIKKFDREDLQDMALADHDPEEYQVEVNKITDSNRRSNLFNMIFKDIASGKYYLSYYSKGATEMQDESPYECEDEIIECQEVEPYEKISVSYKMVEDNGEKS